MQVQILSFPETSLLQCINTKLTHCSVISEMPYVKLRGGLWPEKHEATQGCLPVCSLLQI